MSQSSTSAFGIRFYLGLTLFALLAALSFATHAQELKIHQINTGWGNSTYMTAPNGKTVLMDAADTGMGTNQVKPYLASISAPTLIDVV